MVFFFFIQNKVVIRNRNVNRTKNRKPKKRPRAKRAWKIITFRQNRYIEYILNNFIIEIFYFCLSSTRRSSFAGTRALVFYHLYIYI